MYDLQAVKAPNDDRYLDALGLARDLCTGVASFFAAADGHIVVSVSPNLSGTADVEHVRALAARSLSHPLAQGRQFFTNAEATIEGLSDDESLACIVYPVWEDDRWVGVIGVADTWLPDLGDEQKLGLQRIGELVARREGKGFQGHHPDHSLLERTVLNGGFVDDGDLVGFGSGHFAERVRPISLPELPIDQMADLLPEPMLVVRRDGTIACANQAFAEIYGADPTEILGSEVGAHFISGGDNLLEAPRDTELVQFLVGAPYPGRRLILVARNVDHVPVDVSGRSVDLCGFGKGFIVQVRDARRRDALPGGMGEWSLETALDALDEGIVVCDTDGVVQFVNHAGRELQGLAEDEELVGHRFPAITGLTTMGNVALTWDQHPLARALRGTIIRGEHLLRGSDAATHDHILASAQPLLVSGDRGALLVLRDVTTQTIEEARLTQLALHDPLTGLANRHLLLDHLRRLLGDTRNRGGIVALVFIDLDDFKMINDEFGHDVGDEVLVAVGRRLERAVRSSDLVARLGGDEFVVAHNASSDPDEPYQVVSRIQKTLSVPYQVRGHALVVTCSIGWVVADQLNDDPIDLLVRADREMYRSKKNRS